MAVSKRSTYICGPLDELPHDQQEPTRKFYEALGAVCSRMCGTEAFVPHMHYYLEDGEIPVLQEVNVAKHERICHDTSLLIVVASACSWIGREIVTAMDNEVPIILLYDANLPQKPRAASLLRDSPMVHDVITFYTMEEAILQLEMALRCFSPDAPLQLSAGHSDAIIEVTQQAGLSH